MPCQDSNFIGQKEILAFDLPDTGASKNKPRTRESRGEKEIERRGKRRE